MKVIISENKLTNSIYNYIDETFNPNDMDWVYGIDEDEYGYPDIDRESKNLLMFYNGEWNGYEYSDFVFHYFDIDYYDKNDPSHKPFRDEAPILEVLGENGRHLNTMFDNHWHEPMKKWFQDNFNLPVKTLSTYYNYENFN
jgi:hypothetical protein